MHSLSSPRLGGKGETYGFSYWYFRQHHWKFSDGPDQVGDALGQTFWHRKLQPSRVVPPTQPGEPAPDKQARRRRNRARAESVKWTSNMVIWTVIMLFSSAMLPILLSSRLNINVNLMYTRLSWIPVENVSAIKIALTLSAIAFIPVFIVGQIATQYFERFYDREWGDVTPQKYFCFLHACDAAVDNRLCGVRGV